MPLNHPPPFKLALFDLDGTLTVEKSAWEYIHRRLGVWDGTGREISAGLSASGNLLRRILPPRCRHLERNESLRGQRNPQGNPAPARAGELIAYLREKGVRLGIISSGLSFLSDRVKEKFGFDYAVANDLQTEDGILTGDIRINVHYDQKAEWVEDARRKFDLEKEEVLAVGDSSGDIPMFQGCGFSIAFNCHSPRLESVATI